MEKGLIFKALREVRGFANIRDFAHFSGFDVKEISEIENGSEKIPDRIYMWLEASEHFIQNAYTNACKYNWKEAEIKCWINEQLMSEEMMTAQKRASEMKILYAMMQVKGLSVNEFAKKIGISSQNMIILLHLEKNTSDWLLKKLSCITGIKDYEILQLFHRASEIWDFYDILMEVTMCCKKSR